MRHKAKPRSAQPAHYVFKVEALSHEGRGIAHYGNEPGHPAEKQGKKIFITGALPGETVQARITHHTKRLEEADSVQLLSEPSSYRIEPVCPHFGLCGGCSLQHMHPDEQIRFKQDVLASHLKHFAAIEPEEWLPALRSTREDYRRKARIGVRFLAKEQKLKFGFRERQTNHLVSIQTCKVLDRAMADHLNGLQLLLESLTAKAAIGHIELAMGDHDIALVIRNIEKLPQVDVNQLTQYALSRQWQLYLQPAGPESLYRLDQPDASNYLHYRLEEFDIDFAFSPLDFTQVNSTVNSQMVSLACNLLNLQPGERVLDLFCGLGNFSLPLARCVGETGQVIAVEGSEDMVKRGTENARSNELLNVHFYSQDLTKDFSSHSWAKQGFDALLIDPPRAGAEEVMHYLPNFNAKRIVYVSCNPATLARDAGILVEHGYQLKKAGVMDMFTHTGHVESIVLFEKINKIND